jgi:hypothetical protein
LAISYLPFFFGVRLYNFVFFYFVFAGKPPKGLAFFYLVRYVRIFLGHRGMAFGLVNIKLFLIGVK